MNMQIEAPRKLGPAMVAPMPLAETGGWNATGLDLPDDLRFEDWLSVGHKLRSVEQSVMWWIGDWLRFGESRYGETYRQAVAVTGYSEQHLADAKYVAGAYPASERSEKLSWWHHKVAAPLPPEERTSVLSQAVESDWSGRDMRAEIARRKSPTDDQGIVLPPAFKPRQFQRLGDMIRASFSDWFGIGDPYAAVLMTLFAAGGATIAPRDLAVSVDSHRPMTMGALHEAISSIRKTMDAEALDRNDDGYCLSEVGLTECRRAIREEASALAGFGLEPANDWGPGRVA